MLNFAQIQALDKEGRRDFASCIEMFSAKPIDYGLCISAAELAASILFYGVQNSSRVPWDLGSIYKFTAWY